MDPRHLLEDAFGPHEAPPFGRPSLPVDLRRDPMFDHDETRRATPVVLSPVLCRMRMGAILVAVDGQVAYLNEAAKEALDGDAGLLLRGDRITASAPETRRRFVVALNNACRAPFVDGAVLLGPRRGTGSAKPLRVLSMERMQGLARRSDEGLALLCLRTVQERTPDAFLLAQLFGLTAAESTLMAGIAAGRRLHECAAQRGVSLATVRAQLRNVFVKTGAGTQADLTLIAWSIPGLWIN